MAEEPKSADARTADFAVICSQKVEVQPLLKHIDRQRKYVDEGLVFRGGFIDQVLRIVVVEAGFDFAQHRRAAQIAINEHHPRWVVSTGCSLALKESIGTGDVCLANEISDTHENRLELSNPLEGGKRIHCGQHVVTDQPAILPAQQQRLAESSSADAADLGSLAVAQVCHEKTSPEEGAENLASFLSIRAALSCGDVKVTEQLLKVAFCASTDVSGPSVKQWLSKLKPDPVRRDALKQLEGIGINSNRYLLQVIRKLGEKLLDKRW